MFSAPKPTAIACAVLACAFAQAQTPANTLALDPVVVTATRFETPLSESLSSINVLTRDQIAASQAASLADLLSGQTGYEFGRNGGPGTTTSFFLRGLNSTNLVVMIDGLRAPIDGIGAIAAIDLPLSDIERVEILRGNASALYGDAANGGVIQIFTRQRTAGFTAEAMVGSRSASSLHASYAQPLADTQVAIAASDERSAKASSQNPSVKPGASSDRDSSHTRSINVSVLHPLTRTSSLKASLGQVKATVGYDDSNFGFGLETDRHEMTRVSDTLALNWRTQASPDWKSDLSLGHVNQHIEDRKNAALRTSDYNFGVADNEQTTLRWSNNIAISRDLLLNAGGEASAERYSSDAIQSGYDSKRDTQALFAGLTRYAQATSLQANWRFDHIELQDTKLRARRSWNRHSLSLGAGYDLAANWRASANLSTGFRVPTSYDIALDQFIRMEKHLNREISLRYAQGATLLRATAFWHTADDLIINHPDTYQQTNTNAKNHGLELEGQHQFGNNRLRASLVVQDPVNRSINQQLARRAKAYGSLTLERDWSATTLGLTLRASQQRYDSNYKDYSTGEYTILPGYTTVDLSASRALSRQWTLRGKVENLTDRRYELARGYNTPRRGVFVSLAYQAK